MIEEREKRVDNDPILTTVTRRLVAFTWDEVVHCIRIGRFCRLISLFNQSISEIFNCNLMFKGFSCFWNNFFVPKSFRNALSVSA